MTVALTTLFRLIVNQYLDQHLMQMPLRSLRTSQVRHPLREVSRLYHRSSLSVSHCLAVEMWMVMCFMGTSPKSTRNKCAGTRAYLFSPPLGQASMDYMYVNENTRLLHAYNDMTPLERVALQAILVMLGLLLQKPHSKLGAKEFSRHLTRCLALWKEGKIMDLLAEACTIQSRLPEWDSCSCKCDN